MANGFLVNMVNRATDFRCGADSSKTTEVQETCLNLLALKYYAEIRHAQRSPKSQLTCMHGTKLLDGNRSELMACPRKLRSMFLNTIPKELKTVIVKEH